MIQCWAYPSRGLLTSLEFWRGFSRRVGMATAFSSLGDLCPAHAPKKVSIWARAKDTVRWLLYSGIRSAARAHSNALRCLRFSGCSLFFDKGRTVAQRHLNCIPNFHAQRSPLGVPSAPSASASAGFLQTRKDSRSSWFSLTLLWVCAFSNLWLMERMPIMLGHQKFGWWLNEKIPAVFGALSRALIGGRPQPWRPWTNRSEFGVHIVQHFKKQPLCQEMQKELEKFKAAF